MHMFKAVLCDATARSFLHVCKMMAGPDFAKEIYILNAYFSKIKNIDQKNEIQKELC